MIRNFNPFSSTDHKKGLPNSVDPDETARTSRLIRIYTVSLFSYFVFTLLSISISIFAHATFFEIMDR